MLDVLLARLEVGRERYGYLDLAKPRDWQRERAEELVDAAIYNACDLLSKGDAEDQRERQDCEAADALARTAPVEFGLRELERATRDSAEPLPPVPDFDTTDVDVGGEP